MRRSDTKIRSDTVIVGVVKDAIYGHMRDPIYPVYYSVAAQAGQQRSMNFYVRTSSDPLHAAAPSAARSRPRSNLPVVNLRTMQSQIDANVANERLLSMLTGAFAGPGDAARRGRALRRARVQRGPAHAGDRHSMALGAGAAQVRRLVPGEVL